MAGSPDATSLDVRTDPGWFSMRFAFEPAPRRFTVTSFARRVVQHVIIYCGILIAATYTCLFVFAPAETSLVSILCIAVGGVAVGLLSPPRRKWRRLVEGGLAASYIAGAAALLKAFDSFLHRM